jgi:hypothetical protein
MKWQFNVPNGTSNVLLNAEIIYTTKQAEKIKVTGKDFDVTVIGNRPLLEATERSYPINWRIAQGETKDQSFFTKVTKAIEQHVKQNAGNNVSMYNEMRKTA